MRQGPHQAAQKSTTTGSSRERSTTSRSKKIDIPPIPEFIELVADSGTRLYACKATVDMFGLTMEDFVPQVEEIISVGEFYEKAAGGQIIFT
jgi:peroxiredoxin family protein